MLWLRSLRLGGQTGLRLAALVQLLLYILVQALLNCCTLLLLYNVQVWLYRKCSTDIVVQPTLQISPPCIRRAVTAVSGVKIKAPRSTGEESYSDQTLKFQLNHDERAAQLRHPGKLVKLIQKRYQ